MSFLLKDVIDVVLHTLSGRSFNLGSIKGKTISITINKTGVVILNSESLNSYYYFLSAITLSTFSFITIEFRVWLKHFRINIATLMK